MNTSLSTRGQMAAPQISVNRAFPAQLRSVLDTLLRQSLAVLLLMLVAALLSYGPALQGSFVWDDHMLVESNPAIRSPVMLGEIFRHYLSFNSPATFYRPVQNVSFLLDYWVWGLDPFGFRLTNLLLHAGNGWLLYLVLRTVLPKLSAGREHFTADAGLVALLIALCWLVHPVHNAAVAYIAGRADSLAVGFALAAWLGYESGTASRQRVSRALFHLLAFISLLLAFCSKEIATIWLAIFGVYLFFRPELPARQRVAAFACGLLALALYAGLRHLPTPPAGMLPPAPPPLPWKPVLMARALGDYIGLLLCPAQLHMERQVFPAYGQTPTPAELGHYHFLLCLGLLAFALLLFLASRRGPGRAWRVFGATWFALAYLPISNLFLLNASVAEHWLYTPSIGFLIFLAGCWPLLPARVGTRHFAIASAVCVLPLLIVRTSLRSADWLNDITLFQQALDAGTHSTRARLSLANAYARQGKLPTAEAMLRTLVADRPNYGTAKANLANVLLRQHKTAEAIPLLRPLIDLPGDPTSLVTAWKSLTLIPGQQPDPAQMLIKLDQTLARLPGSWDLIDLKAQLLHHSGRSGEAVSLLTDFTRKQWWCYPAWILLGQIAATDNRSDQALDAFAHAGRLDVRESLSRQLSVLLCLNQDKLAQARTLQEETLRRRPNDPLSYTMLAEIATRAGNADEARLLTAQAQRLRE